MIDVTKRELPPALDEVELVAVVAVAIHEPEVQERLDPDQAQHCAENRVIDKCERLRGSLLAALDPRGCEVGNWRCDAAALVESIDLGFSETELAQ